MKNVIEKVASPMVEAEGEGLKADLIIAVGWAARHVIRAQDKETPVVELPTYEWLERFAIPATVNGRNLLVLVSNTPTHRTAEKAFAFRMMTQGYQVYGYCPKKEGATWSGIWKQLGRESFSAGQFIIHDDQSECSLPACIDPNIAELGKSVVYADIMRYFNSQYFVTSMSGDTVVLHEGMEPKTGIRRLDSPMDKYALYDLYAPLEIPWGEDGKPACIAKVWFKSKERRQYKGMHLDPTLDPELAKNWYNLFYGWPYRPISGGGSAVFWEHALDVICAGNQERYVFLRKWLAQLFQRPDVRPTTAIIMQGMQGTGKTAFAEVIGKLAGPHYRSNGRIEQVTSRFNSPLMTALLVYVDEFSCNDSDQRVLKTYTGKSTLEIEIKGRERFEIENYLRFLLSTNEKTTPVFAGDNRRFWLYRLSDHRRNDRKYFGHFKKETERREVLEAIMYDLMTEDLSGFDIHQPPDGREAFDLALQGSSMELQWLYEVLKADSGEIFVREKPDEPRRVPIGVIRADWMRWSNGKKYPPDIAVVLKSLKKLIPFKKHRLTDVQGAEGGSDRVWYYDLPSLTECRNRFCKHFSMDTYDWDDCE